MNLPIDLIVLLLSYFQFSDFIRMKSLNRQVHQLISTKKICWKNQVAHLKLINSIGVPQNLHQWAPFLLHLSVYFTDAVECCSLKGCAQLESLRLECSGNLAKFGVWARRECMAYKNVEKLSVYLITSTCYEYDNFPFYKCIPYNNTIKELELFIEQPKPAPEVLDPAKFLNFTQLRKLTVLHECKAKSVFQTLFYVPTITDLSVKCNDLTLLSKVKDGYLRDVEFFNSLTKFEWYYNGTNADINKQFVKDCARFSQLRDFAFYGPVFSLPFLFSVLQHLTSLQTLTLRGIHSNPCGFYKWSQMAEEGIAIKNITSLFLSNDSSSNITSIKRLFPNATLHFSP
jgi:hypothetical protein